MNNLPVQVRRASRLFISRRIFQFSRQFRQLRLESLNLLFQFADHLLLRFAFVGTRLALLRFNSLLFLAIS